MHISTNAHLQNCLYKYNATWPHLCVQDDEDNGDSFTYTGAGGRDLSGNKRTAEQSFDQVLNKSNAAIARYR